MNFGHTKEARAYTYISRAACNELDVRAAAIGCTRAALIRRCIVAGLKLTNRQLGGGLRKPSGARVDLARRD